MAIDLHDIFLHKMPTLLLLAVGGHTRTYISVVAKECDCTYPHAVKILREMEQYGLIKSEKLGRVKYVALTDFGRVIESSLKQLIKTLGATNKYTQDDLSYVDSKIDNIIHRVDVIRQALRENQRLSAEEITKVGKKLGPYYRELKIVEGLVKAQPNNYIVEKVAIAKSELAEVKAEIASKRTKG
jgi:DNA-binding MarR family transcriptional regulator